MTKHLRFLFVMLLAMIWSAGHKQQFGRKTGVAGNQVHNPKT